jgi:hypothetical protein
MRILIRTSKLAIWARRLGGFSLPLAVIPVFMHRAEVMTPDTFFVLEALAATIATIALLLGIAGCVRLWFTGDRGWGRAIGGIMLGLICLAPFIYVTAMWVIYPKVRDVSTDQVQNLTLTSALPPASGAVVTPEAIEAAFPNARTRRYQLDAMTIFKLVSDLVADRGWTVKTTQPPQGVFGDAQINAIAMTLPGWRDELAVRVTGDEDGSSVAMRSASLTGLDHDLGSNGTRIEEFLVALDKEVTLVMRDLPQGGEPGEDVPAGPVDPNAPPIPAPPIVRP